MTLTALFIAVTQFYNLPSGLLQSICYTESKLDVNAVHHDDGGSDSLGVCQVKTTTTKWLGFGADRKDIMDPRINVYAAGYYLRVQLDRYHGDTAKAVIAYNRGNARGLISTEYQRKVFKQWRH